MTIYFLNGQFVEEEDVTISIDDRGYYFGDGIYEVVKVYSGKLFSATEHINRLFESAAKIKISIPFTKEELMTMAVELIAKNKLKDGHFYIQVTRGASPRQHQFPNPSVAPVIIAYTVNTSRPISAMTNGVSAKMVVDVRWLRCDIKSLNLLGSVLAKQEAIEAGCYEAILHRDGVITEGSSTNIFGIKDGVIHTHPATNLILNGITRQAILHICNELKFPIQEKEFTVEETFDMDELFLTSTTSEVIPITTVDGRTIYDGKPGPITKKLQEAYSLQVNMKEANS